MLKYIADNIKIQICDHVLNQEAVTELALTAFFAGGHILLSGSTGLGKTRWAQAFTDALGISYNRIRFTENTHPSEILESYARDPENQGVESCQGFLSSQSILADEIDNAHPEIHTIVMDIMDRHNHSLTVSGVPSPFPGPHLVIGSCKWAHNLPETLSDRFMMKLYINYPGVAAEKQILQMYHVGAAQDAKSVPICTPDAIAQAKHEVQAVAVEDAIFNYIVSIVETTRRVSAIQTGVSPRGSIALLMAAKAYAAINGRDFVTIDDVRNLAIPVLRHRINLRPDAIKEGIQADRIIESIIVGKG